MLARCCGNLRLPIPYRGATSVVLMRLKSLAAVNESEATTPYLNKFIASSNALNWRIKMSYHVSACIMKWLRNIGVRGFLIRFC